MLRLQPMEAVTWTVVGILGAALFASFGGFFFLSGKIDAQGAELGRRIESQGDELRARIDAQGAELGARIESQGAELGRRIESQGAELGSRIDALGARLDNQEVRFDRLSDQMAELVVSVRALTATVQTHLARHAG